MPPKINPIPEKSSLLTLRKYHFSQVHLGFNQESRTSRRYIFIDLLQGIGLCNCGGQLDKSKIHRADHQEGQNESQGTG